ncbi:MAG: methyltransferase family protein, partial [Candidatus Thorarchaeota archaeon]
LTLFSTAIQMPFLFWPAGTIFWLEAWTYLIIFFVTFSPILIVLNNKNPEILINRMKLKKQMIRKEKGKAVEEKDVASKASGTDKVIFPLLSVSFLAVFVIPALNKRYNWSIPLIWVEIIGFLLLPISLYIIYRVMLENAYASKILDIRKDSGQKLIDSGPYAIVRHPMYSGFALMFFSIVLALGSWYALIPAVLAIIFLGIRIKFEEAMLIEGLEGYKIYKEKVKYKLIPKIY